MMNTLKSLKLDKTHKKVCGACAGVANYLSQDVWLVRLVAVISLIIFTTPTLLLYVLAALALPSSYSRF